RSHVVNLHPLLQDALLCQVGAAEFVELLVVDVGFATDPDGSDFDGDEIVAVFGEEEMVAAVGHEEPNALVVIDDAPVDGGGPGANSATSRRRKGNAERALSELPVPRPITRARSNSRVKSMGMRAKRAWAWISAVLLP